MAASSSSSIASKPFLGASRIDSSDYRKLSISTVQISFRPRAPKKLRESYVFFSFFYVLYFSQIVVEVSELDD